MRQRVNCPSKLHGKRSFLLFHCVPSFSMCT
uniref:Uncharacterized protein n=1 Tax=Rhizophora mucronata TaxID=61149 RepID=A0A2P2LPR6_RHIMU